jgi:hypothetical protein
MKAGSGGKYPRQERALKSMPILTFPTQFTASGIGHTRILVHLRPAKRKFKIGAEETGDYSSLPSRGPFQKDSCSFALSNKFAVYRESWAASRFY